MAAIFTGLSHPSRVDILRCVLPMAEQGLPAGDIAAQTSVPPSTLSHHLDEMEKGGVITRTPQGRKTIIRPQFTKLMEISALLSDLCCPPAAQSIPDQKAKTCAD